MKKLLFSVSLKDCEVQTFRAGGKGGQNQNKVESGVRVIHRQSGAVGEARDSRNQLQNKKSAFLRMANSQKFQLWVNREGQEVINGQSIEEVVDASLTEENLKIEIRGEAGKWEILP